MLEAHPDLTRSVIFGLGWYYLLMFAMNAYWTARSYKQDGSFGKKDVPYASIWASYSAVLLLLALVHFVSGFASSGDASSFTLRMPLFFKNFLDQYFANPIIYFVMSVALYVLLIWWRKWLIKPTVAWTLLNIALLFMGLSLTDYDFRMIVGKPDNVPIVAMLFIVSFFTWLYFTRAIDNDQRIAEGRPLFEQEGDDKVLVWPDLVYTELICMVVLTVILVFWGMALQAPLEEPATAVKTPNPSKAPWYFLGLQEMLVYFDPWLAGVVLPSLILGGLMAIPYIDFNKKGNGYYCFEQRRFAISTFLFGFLPLWIAMIVLGTFLRGPNWNFFGIYEYWDVHKLEALNNVNLSEYVWVYSPLSSIYGGLPVAEAGSGIGSQVGHILLREGPGILAVLLYFMVLPPLLALTVFRNFFQKMGFIRFMVFSNLVLWMAILPIKMVLRWLFNLKYIVAIPEWFFNI